MAGIQIGTSDVLNSSREFDNITGADGNYDGLHARLVGGLSGTAINMSVPMTRHTMTANTTFSLTGISAGTTCMLLLDRGADLHTPTFPAGIEWPTEPTWENWRYWQIVLTCPRGTQVTGNAIGFVWSGVNGEAPGGAAFEPTFSKPSGWRYSNKQVVASESRSTVFTAVSIYLAHDEPNNRILVRFAYSDDQTQQVANDVYVGYTNLTNISDIEFKYKYADTYAQWSHTPTAENGWSPGDTKSSPQKFVEIHGPGPIPELDDRSASGARQYLPDTWYSFFPSSWDGTSFSGSSKRLVWKAGAVHPSSGLQFGSAPWNSRVGVAWGTSISDNLSIRITCDEGQFISTCNLGGYNTVGNTTGAVNTDPVVADIELLAIGQANI